MILVYLHILCMFYDINLFTYPISVFYDISLFAYPDGELFCIFTLQSSVYINV